MLISNYVATYQNGWFDKIWTESVLKTTDACDFNLFLEAVYRNFYGIKESFSNQQL